MNGIKIEELIKPFVIKWEEAYSMKLPRIRKYHYKTTI